MNSFDAINSAALSHGEPWLNPPMAPPFDSKSLEFSFSGLKPPLLTTKDSIGAQSKSNPNADVIATKEFGWWCTEQWK